MRFNKLIIFAVCAAAAAVAAWMYYAERSGRSFKNDPELCYEKIPSAYRSVDVDELITVRSAREAGRARERMIKELFNSGSLPRRQPDLILKDSSPPEYADLSAFKNLERVDEFRVTMEPGITSRVFLFVPKEKNNRLFVFHQGHRSSLEERGVGRMLRKALQEGFHVAAFYMLAFGPNSGPFDKRNHDFSGLEEEGNNPLRYHLEPVAVVLNALTYHLDFRDITMIGISGGGWVATLYSAIDPRIDTSIQVAATYPGYLRQPPCGEASIGDYEQGFSTSTKIRGFYRMFDGYLGLYVLAAGGKGRRHFQIINQYDSCCFNGLGFRTYEDKVKERVNDIGDGFFDVILDTTHKDHRISDWTAEKIFEELQ